jgi:hypothetical protein
MAGLPINIPIPAESAIASYSWTDIASGQGVTSWYLSTAENLTNKSYLLLDRISPISTTDGKLSINSLYYFKTSTFNTPRTVLGNAYLSGYADWTSSTGLTMSAKLRYVFGTAVDAGLGATTYTDAAESTTSATSYTLVKTLYIDNYLGKVDFQLKATANVWAKIVFNYSGSTADSSEAYHNNTTWTAKSVVNPNLTSRVATIGVYIKTSGSDTARIQNVVATSELVSGITETDITSEIIGETKTADGYFLMSMPITQTNLKIGSYLVLVLKPTGGVGNYVLDPQQNFYTTQSSLKINIPFKIDL